MREIYNNETIELCGECDKEVIIIKTLQCRQTCPSCGKEILACNECSALIDCMGDNCIFPINKKKIINNEINSKNVL